MERIGDAPYTAGESYAAPKTPPPTCGDMLEPVEEAVHNLRGLRCDDLASQTFERRIAYAEIRKLLAEAEALEHYVPEPFASPEQRDAWMRAHGIAEGTQAHADLMSGKRVSL